MLPSLSYMYFQQVWWLYSPWKLRYEVLINYVIMWHAGMTYRNIKTYYNKSRDVWEWDHFIRICIPTKFGDCSLWESCDITFLIYHVITRSKLMPPNGYMQFHHYHQICFTCLFWNLWKLVMQSQAVIKKWDRNQLLQSYYKVWQKFITKCVRYYKVRQLLQSETSQGRVRLECTYFI